MSETVSVILGPIRRRTAAWVSAAEKASPIALWGGEGDYVDHPGTGRTYHLSDEGYRAGLEDSEVVRLLAWCRETGVPYHLSSSGDYECAGEIRQWVPGMAEEFRVRADGGEEPFLTEATCWNQPEIAGQGLSQ